MAAGIPAMQMRFDQHTIRRGLLIFFVISTAMMALVFVFSDSARTVSAIRQMDPLFLGLALACAVLDSLGGGLRMYVLARGLEGNLSFPGALKSSLASIAMGAVTPSQAGGGPAMIFMLMRNGLSLAGAMSSGVMSFVVTVLFFVVAATAITAMGIDAPVEDATVRGLFRWGIAAFMVVGLGFVALTTWPALLRGLLERTLNFMSRFRSRHFVRPGSKAQRLLKVVQDFHDTNATYFRSRLPHLVASFLITGIVFGLKCLIAYFVVRGLGVETSVWDVTSIQILILLAVYFFPTPGGAGAAELGSAVLMAAIVPQDLLGVYVVLWRVVVMYLAVLVGSGVMVRELGQDVLVAGDPGELAVEKKIAGPGN